jgi:hypothetical protein
MTAIDNSKAMSAPHNHWSRWESDALPVIVALDAYDNDRRTVVNWGSGKNQRDALATPAWNEQPRQF